MDLLLVYLLRTWFAGHHDDAWGRALSDPAVGAALSLIHADPGRAWTLDTLARAMGDPEDPPLRMAREIATSVVLVAAIGSGAITITILTIKFGELLGWWR